MRRVRWNDWLYDTPPTQRPPHPKVAQKLNPRNGAPRPRDVAHRVRTDEPRDSRAKLVGKTEVSFTLNEEANPGARGDFSGAAKDAGVV